LLLGAGYKIIVLLNSFLTSVDNILCEKLELRKNKQNKGQIDNFLSTRLDQHYTNSNNSNNRIYKAPYGRNFRGAYLRLINAMKARITCFDLFCCKIN